MAKRILLGSLMVAVIVTLYCLDRNFSHPFLFILMVGGLATAATYELAKLLESQHKPLFVDRWILMVCGLTLLFLVSFSHTGAVFDDIIGNTAKWAMIMTVFTMVMAAMTRVWEREVELFGSKLAGTTFGFIYIWVPSALLIGMRRLDLHGGDGETGFWLIAWLLIVVRLGTDSGAYFVGKFFAKRLEDNKTPKHPMVPHVSPGKTWEGTTGGLIIGTAIGIILAAAAPRLTKAFNDNWIVGFIIAVVMSFVVAFVGVHGDLVESAIKRSSKVKDSSLRVSIPEFGGVLDLIDSTLLATPILFIAVAAHNFRI